MRDRRGLLAMGLLGALSCILTQARGQAAPAEVKTAYDVPYTKVGDRELKLDIAYPAEGEGPFPGVMVIHGGAWRAGDKNSNRDVMNRLAKQGYVAVSPQYRFCPAEVFPAQVYDVKEALRWVKRHASDYRLDATRMGAMGFSAGGHLALMLGVTDADDGLEGDTASDAPSTRVQVVVNYFGPTDLLADDIPDVSKPLLRDFLGGIPAEKAELAKQGSPLTWVTKDDPPILTFQGTRDPLVPHSQAVKLNEAMTAAGVKGRVELIVGGGHGDWGRREIERTFEETVRFLDLYLKPAK